MWRAVRFIVIAALLLVLAWWIGGLPGDVTAVSGPYRVETSVPAALLILVLIALLLTALLRVLGGVRRAPGGVLAWRGGRRQRLGEIATQRGLVALAAGDAAAARAEAGRARKCLGDTPLVLLLTAESARLAGMAEQAQEAFRQLAQHKDMGFLGHHGLLRHSLAVQDHEAARDHVVAAERAYPGSAWLQEQKKALAVRQQDWGTALALTRNPAEIAAFATAAASASTTPQNALAYAKKAVKASPGLAPAVVAYAAALRQVGKPRAAKKALAVGWKAAPHPLIAAAYLDPLATPLERAQAASELAAVRPNHPESELVLGETALAARLTGEARRHAEAALATHADDGRATDILARLEGKLAHAGSDAGWVCESCQTRCVDWAPICPHCQRLGTLVWRAQQ
ncbi:heme biosynthesis HemY N-terminal domain-containing protein [Acidocella sp.]|jgi:HemY protein|uniref:heme biosynthesis HemY N-terminal domain-containing protein n=1 Tax=Acidocella sp. TaxID=50710 RepID=UPI002F3EA63F